jgi:hypothetical protein
MKKVDDNSNSKLLEEEIIDEQEKRGENQYEIKENNIDFNTNNTNIFNENDIISSNQTNNNIETSKNQITSIEIQHEIEKVYKFNSIENTNSKCSNLINSSTTIISLPAFLLPFSNSNSNSNPEQNLDSTLIFIESLDLNSNSHKNTKDISITDFQEDLNFIEFDKKRKIINETFELTDDPNYKNLFDEETFEKMASIINSKFYKNLERLLEKITKTNIIKKIRIKLIKILICFIPSCNKIDYINLRKLISEGLPEEIPELRSLLWKLFLNYYPNDLEEWEIISKEKSEDYEKIKSDIIDENSKEKYKNLLYEITSDTTRTRTDMNFFNKNNKLNEEEGIFGDLLIRILFIFAVLHPDISYIQGMNEILGTIYFSFAKSNEINLESDLFYCFENFILEVKDIYLQDNDNKSKGINGLVKKTEEILEKYDLELFNHFNDLGIEILIILMI